jgi:pimeloyl-ACP methyl ester carboxylesterase
MQTTSVQAYSFGYYDSGAPPNRDYSTIIVVHGNTYHAGTFLTLFDGASALNLRVILVQRRRYPGSSPYTDEETKAILQGTEEERHTVLDTDGELLALFVDNMIRDYDLKKVAIVAWSQGTGYLNLIVDAIKRVGAEAQERLQTHVYALIHWDPPCGIMGLDYPPTGAWTPLYDYTLSPEKRAEAFGQWLAFHFPHPNLSSRDPQTLIYKLETHVKSPSFSNVPIEKFLTMVDFTANAKGEYVMGEDYYKSIMFERLRRAFMDPSVRKLWKNAKFCCIYGEESPWNVEWSVWSFEKLFKDKELEIYFEPMEGANHFVMSDNPDQVLKVIKKLVD